MTEHDPAGEAYEEVLAAARRAGELIRNPDRGVTSAEDRAAGYLYATELVRQSLDLYVDGDGDTPRFIPFSSPLRYHAGDIPTHRIQGGVNPDGLYDFVALRPGRSYRVSGRRGNDCYLSLSFSAGRSGDRPERTAATLNDESLTFDDDGSFVVTMSPDPQPGNWVPLDDSVTSMIVRQYFLQPLDERVPATFTIEAIDDIEPLPAAEAAAERLRAAARFIDATVAMYPFPDYDVANGFGEPLGYDGNSGALGTTDNCYVMGRWQLSPGQALVVETTPIPCRYWSLQLWNRWGQSMDITVGGDNYDRQIVNLANAWMEADGSVRITISDSDPGDGNWLDTFGWDKGVMILRYLYPEAKPLRPEATVLDGHSRV